MPTYIWEARTKDGLIRSGTVQADTENSLNERLRNQGLIITKIKKKPMEFVMPSFGGGVGLKDLVVFSRTFSTMIDAGLPIVQCIDMLGNQSESPKLRQTLMGVKAEVEAGKSLSEAMGNYPKVFDDLMVNLIAAGEAGGILDVIFRRLATYIEKASKLRRQVRGAMVYPAVIGGIGILVVIVMITQVLPTFEKMFQDFGAGSLPAATRFVLGISHALITYWYLFIIGTAGLVAGITMLLRSEAGAFAYDSMVLRMPLVGPVARKVAVARFTRTLGTLLSSGVAILDGMDIVARTAGNRLVSKAILYTRNKVSEGKDIATPLMETGVFPPMVVQMIGVGEQTGAMDDMLQKIADFYEDEVDVAVSAMTSMLGPLMLVFLGALVGGMLIAMYMPIFEVAGNIK
jgi:type IV pilus assembly protein PilC